MANRLLKATATIAANVVDEQVAAFAPEQNQRYELEELWTDQNGSVDITMHLNERKVMPSIPSDSLPGPGDGLVFDLDVNSGQELSVSASETAGAEAEVGVYLVVNETNR